MTVAAEALPATLKHTGRDKTNAQLHLIPFERGHILSSDTNLFNLTVSITVQAEHDHKPNSLSIEF